MRWQRLRLVSFVALTTGAASAMSLLGGLSLEAVQVKLLPLVPLVIAMPALNTMVGDYAAIIAAHASDPAERATTKKQLFRAISKAIWVNIVGIIVLSLVVAAQRDYLLTLDFLLTFSGFVVVAMTSTVAVMFGLTSLLDKLLEQHRLNPSDILIPIVTSITDIFMLGLIASAAWFLF